MIVTRQRKKKKSSLPILLPIAAIAMLVIALTWPPSRNFITNGPLKPVATVVRRDLDHRVAAADLRLSAAADHRPATNEIKDLNDKLESRPQGRRATRTPQVAAASEADRRSQQPARARDSRAVAAALRSAAGAGCRQGAAGSATVAAVSNAVKTAAQEWSAMDPEKAAALVQKLPTAYVATVFAQMSPDSVGPIMDALPPKVAALIVESATNAQISAQPGR